MNGHAEPWTRQEQIRGEPKLELAVAAVRDEVIQTSWVCHI